MAAADSRSAEATASGFGLVALNREMTGTERRTFWRFVVPKGIAHRTRGPDQAVILMAETASIVPTGDD